MGHAHRKYKNMLVPNHWQPTADYYGMRKNKPKRSYRLYYTYSTTQNVSAYFFSYLQKHWLAVQPCTNMCWCDTSLQLPNGHCHAPWEQLGMICRVGPVQTRQTVDHRHKDAHHLGPRTCSIGSTNWARGPRKWFTGFQNRKLWLSMVKQNKSYHVTDTKDPVAFWNPSVESRCGLGVCIHTSIYLCLDRYTNDFIDIHLYIYIVYMVMIWIWIDLDRRYMDKNKYLLVFHKNAGLNPLNRQIPLRYTPSYTDMNTD